MNSKACYRWITALFGMMLFSFAAVAQQPAFLTNGLVAYYPFNGDAKDASGNGNDGVSSGVVTFVTDRFGSINAAEQFDGETGYITIPKLSAFKYSDVTYSLWVYINKLPPIAGVTGGPDGFHQTTIIGRNRLGDTQIGCLSIITENGVTLTNSLWYYTGADAVSGPPLMEKKWFHLVGSVSKANKVTIYVNGVSSGAGTISSAGASVTDFNLGYSPAALSGASPRYHFNGILDDVRIYNRSLSDSEVAALYKYESTLPDNSFVTNGLVAHYPFDSDAKDASGNGNDLTTVGSPSFAVADRLGTSGNAVKLSGNGDYFFLNKNLQGTAFVKAPMTISFWRKGQNGQGADSAICVETDTTALWAVGGRGFLSMDENVGISGGRVLLHAPVLLDQSTWIQTVYVWNGINSAIYTNGTPVITSSLPSLGIPPNNSKLYIGADPAGGFDYWIGEFDEIRIYDRALSELEVAALYQYESVPQKTDPRQATATATVVNGFVVGATITDVGSGYTKAPKVVISGGGGTGATATATIDANGAVSGIKIVTSGSGYTGIPTIIIDPPPFPPSQAKGTSTLINGFVTGVNITDTGHGYEGVVPPVTFLGGGGKGATGTAIVSNGMVTGISMTASGSGYTNAPYVLIAAPPGLVSAAISVRTVDVTLSLIPGYTYKIQTTTDAGTTWIDVETGILAVDKTLIRSFDVTSQTQLFRVVQLN